MNFKLSLIRVAIIAASVGVSSTGYGQAGLTTPVAESEHATLQAASDGKQLILTARDLPWERVKEFGLIEDHRKNITADIRSGLSNNELRVESTSSGFSLDFGPSGSLKPGEKAEGVLSLKLASGHVASTPIEVHSDTPLEEPAEERPQLHAGFCLGSFDRITPLAQYIKRRQASLMSVPSAGVGPKFLLKQDAHVVLAMAGASWEEVEAVTVQSVKGYDYTTVLREAILRGSTWVLPTADGFRLEIQDADLLEPSVTEVVLTLDTGDVVVAPILSGQ